MAIKFYLQEKNAQHEIHCNTNSTITEIAGTFDLGTMELEWNECKHAIFPNTKFFIEDTESNEIWNFIIAQDNVEIVKKTNAIKYLHTLTLSQSIHKLNNVPLRNTVFTQPYNSERHFTKRTFFAGIGEYIQGNLHHVQSDIQLDHMWNQDNFLKNNYSIDITKKRIKNCSIKVSYMFNIFDQYDTPVTDTSITGVIKHCINRYQNGNYVDYFYVAFINSNDYTDKKGMYVYSAQINQTVALSDEIIAWMSNRKFFVKVTAGLFKPNNVDSVFPSYIEDWEIAEVDINAPFLAGFVNVELFLNTYQYSLWDILDIINKQCIKRYNGSYLPNYYEMPSKASGQGLELDSIVAPEFNFTQMDLYEAVAKVFSFIDAFPVLDTNNVLGFQYLNDLSDETIQGIQVADEKTTLNEENFTNKLATYYQNGKKEDAVNFPAENFFRFPSPDKYGVPGKNDWYMLVNRPIDYIDKLTIICPHNTSITLPPIHFYDTTAFVPDTPQTVYEIFFENMFLATNISENLDVDVSGVLYDSDIYNGYLGRGYGAEIQANQNNSLYYERNSNRIYCGLTTTGVEQQGEADQLQYALIRAILMEYGFSNNYGYYHDSSDALWYSLVTLTYDEANEDKTKIKFNCKYHPIVDGKVSQESTTNKAEKETIVAQSNRSSELERLGNNLQGLIARLGNEEKTVTLPITKLKDRIKLGTHYIDELGNNWIVNRVKTTFTTREDKVIVEATFTRNYNAMQQFTSLNQEKRFYEINNELTTTGYENINEFIYFTTNQNLTNEEIIALSTPIAFRRAGLQAIIDKTFNYFENDYDLVGMNSVFDNAGIWTHESASVYTATYIPPIVYGNGNQICFEMGFNSPIASGKYVDGNNNCNEWLYTKESGEAEYVVIITCFTNQNTTYYSQWYPQITNGLPGTNIFELNDFYYYKKPNEIFHVNYSLNFLPYWTKTTDALGTPQYVYEEIYFGDKFINENGIIPNTDFDNGKQRQFSLWVGNDKYSIIDQKAQGTKVSGTVTVSVYSTEQSYSATTGAATWGTLWIRVNGDLYNTENNKSWCLADENGNIYIAVNKTTNSTNMTSLIWFTSRNRKV